MLMILPSCSWGLQQYYDNGTSDEDYIFIAREHDDSQAFLDRYPQAEVFVDRSGSLAVDFRVTTRPAHRTTEEWEGIRLRVFIDPKTNRPTATLFQCNNRIIENNVRKHLEQYFVTQSCP